jgi:CheY-like chemotaxis protein
VQQSNGAIHVYSEPGLGTTFKIYFPVVAAEPVTTTSELAAESAKRGTETIFLVEDEPGVRALVRKSLEMHGYTVLVATDGKDALQILDSQLGPVDLLLTDVVMPSMSGPELAAHIRSRFPRVKVLFMSGYTDDAVVRHGLLNAEASFIQKPYTPKELARKVRRVLDDDAGR